MRKVRILQLVFVIAGAISAQNAAVSSYLNPNDNFAGDIRIKEVRIPQAGYAINTYWCCMGWYGTVNDFNDSSISGYGGLQYTSDNTKGPHNYLYSMWENNADTAYIDPNMHWQNFGGEGTGLQSFTNFYPWTVGYWNVMADRFWDVGTHTYSALIIKDGKSGVWHHLITIDVPATHERYSSNTYNFIEDWGGDGVYRQGHWRKGWKRRDSNKTWFPITSMTYSINSGDIGSSGRSYNKRNNWEGGTASDSTGQYYFMGAGGSISNTGNNGSTLSIPRTETNPQDEYGTASVTSVEATAIAGGKLAVSWEIDSTTVPQFCYSISIDDGSGTVASKIDTVPQNRTDTLDISSLTPESQQYTLTLNVIDMFDNPAPPATTTFGNGTGIANIGKVSAKPSVGISGSHLSISGIADPKVGIFDVAGRNIKTLDLRGSNGFSLDMKRIGLGAGMYLVRVNSASGFVGTKRFLMQ